MQKWSGHTKIKVVGGYILVFFLTILSSSLIYKQITRLIVNEDAGDDPGRKLYMIGNTVSGLYEAEALGNAYVQTGSEGFFRKYMEIMDETKSNIDSLRQWTSHREQQLRLDTVNNLLDDKIHNLRDISYVKRTFVPEEFYNRAIAHIESGRDTLQEGIDIVKRYITSIDSSYVVSEKKRRRGLFSRARPDSILKVSTVIQVIVDTIDHSLQNTDTVVGILRTAWEDVQKQAETFNRQINQKEYSLIRKSAIITEQLERILSEYEKEEIEFEYRRQQRREQTIATVVRIFAWVAVAVFFAIVFFTFFILRDLSRSQRYRRELENANRFAGRLLESREKLILTVTHDIKSPLNSVMGYIELLGNSPIDDRQRYYLKNMEGSARHILNLVNNLLDLSKLENNRMPLEIVVFNAARLFREISDTFMPLAKAKKLELRCEIDGGLNGNYRGDALRVRQVITNILSNAVKYTVEGTVCFTASCSSDDRQVIMKVTDTGTGMTEEEQRMVFQEFMRLKSHSGIEGTGLGLTITMKLIDLLGGHMELQSEPGKGSCFTVILPLEKVDGAVQPSHPEPVAQPVVRNSHGSPNVLLVDDDPLQLEMVGSILKLAGIRVTKTGNPDEIIRLLETGSYDLLFSDIQMPGINGFELVGKIRSSSLPCAKILPIVALSADPDRQEAEYIQAGFSAYLGKPFTSSQILEVIERFAGLQQMPECTSAGVAGVCPGMEKPGYTLKNIAQFTDGDPESLKRIMKSFVDSTAGNVGLLRDGLRDRRWDTISGVAHKMLPLFRQLEAVDIIPLLEKMEQFRKHLLTEAEMEKVTEELIAGATELEENIRKGMLSDI